MATNRLEEALLNYQEQIEELEYEKSITSNRSQKFEVQKRIEEIEKDIERIKERLNSSGIVTTKEDIVRFIEFPPEYREAGTSILTYFNRILEVKYPNIKATVRIELERYILRMVIQTADGYKEIIEKTLSDYGKVVTGKLLATEFLSDPFEVIALKRKLEIAELELRQAKELFSVTTNNYQKQIDQLYSLIAKSLDKEVNINIKNITQSIGNSNGEATVSGNDINKQTGSFGIGNLNDGTVKDSQIIGQDNQFEKNIVEIQPEKARIIKSELITDTFSIITVNFRGEEIKSVTGQAQCWILNLDKNTILEMIDIPGGSFVMGSPKDEKGHHNDEIPQHQVIIQPFFMGKYPITQAQWKAVANLAKIERDLNVSPSRFKGDNRPVERVSWYDAIEFCTRLSNLTGKDFSLPSEAEWEYACRAGTTTPFYYGETITDNLANYDATETYAEEAEGQYRGETTAVGSFPPNAFGLWDMHGSVWEWCLDNWHDNYKGAPNDGRGWIKENNNTPVVRGGSWNNNPYFCRSADRDFYPSREDYCSFIGLRVVCSSGKI